MPRKTLDHVSPGAPIPRDRGTWNAMIDAARAHRAAGARGARPAGTAVEPVTTMFVTNFTGADLPALSVVRIGDTAATAATAAPYEYQRVPGVSAVEPETVRDAVGVLPAPIAAGATGRAIVQGVAAVDLVVGDADHEYATATPGSTATMTSGPTGPARVLWKEGTSGTVRAVVLLHGAAAAPCPRSAASYGSTAAALNIGHDAWVTVKRVTFPRHGRYLLTGHVPATITATLGAGEHAAVALRLYGEVFYPHRTFAVCATVSGVPTYGAGSLCVVVDTVDVGDPFPPYCDLQAMARASGTGTVTYAGVGEYAGLSPAISGMTASFDWVLLCEHDGLPGSSGSSGCTQIPGWAGPGWYRVSDGNGGCESQELLDEDQCDTSIVICGGPYVDESAADAAGTDPDVSSCCPGLAEQPTGGTVTAEGGCPGVYLGGKVYPAGGGRFETPHSAGWYHWVECSGGTWTAGFVTPDGAVPGTVVSADCDGAGGVVVVVDYAFGAPLFCSDRFTYTLTP